MQVRSQPVSQDLQDGRGSVFVSAETNVYSSYMITEQNLCDANVLSSISIVCRC